MISDVNTEPAAIEVRMIDDAYLAWFGAESECETALRVWFRSSGTEDSVAFAAYVAALDREEAAARDLQKLWDLAELSRPKVALAA